MAFIKRKITVRLTLGQGQFGENQGDTVEITGLRISAIISKAGGASMSTANVRIYGLTMDVMNKLTVQNRITQNQMRLNKIVLLAGDDDRGQSVVFAGTISEAWADFNEMPDTCFLVTAQTGLYESTVPVPPISFNGQADVVTIIGGIATQMGLGLVNYGVTTKIVSAYYPGDLMAQLTAVTRDANINCDMDGANVTIWPANGSRGEELPEISSEAGMVGYPTFTQNTIVVLNEFNAGLNFGMNVIVKSALEPANGTWTIASVNHTIESEMPGGQWFTQIECGWKDGVLPIVT